MRILYNSVWSDVDACDLKADRLHSNTYLLTRFNLKFWRTAKSGMDTRSQEWLQKRFELFEQYCLPSIASQTYGNFAWFCLFADDTPAEYLQRLEYLQQRCPQLYPVLLSESETDAHSAVVTSLIDRVRVQGQPVVTLRVDNDDAIANDFIARAIENTERQKEARTIYWFLRGIQYYHREKIAFAYNFEHNHYPFLINKTPQDGDKNILSFSHGRGHIEGYSQQVIDSDEMWMEVIHDDNVMNEVELTLRQRPVTATDRSVQRFIPLPLHTRQSHYVAFLLPRIARHLMRRIAQKICK